MKIIKITALWCPSCLIMNDLINDNINSSIDLISYDYDMDEEDIKKYNVGTVLPVLIKLDEDNNEVSRLIGEKSKKELLEFLGE